MAEKHKSKYKAPKDLEKSQKPKPRKDLKDYECGHDDETMNPYSTKEPQQKVLRKKDKLVIDDVENMVPKIADKDRLYKKVEDGEYDPKKAAKVFVANQEKDTKELEDAVLEEKINRLSQENRERLVREYIRRKIAKMVSEQTAPEDEAPAEEAPTPEAPTPEAPAEVPAEAPTPEAPAAPTPEAPAEVPAEAPTPEAPAEVPAPEEAEPETTDAEAAPTEEKLGPVKTLENFIIGKTKNPSAVIGTYLSAMEKAINRLNSDFEISTDKKSVKQQIVMWLQNNGYLTNK